MFGTDLAADDEDADVGAVVGLISEGRMDGILCQAARAVHEYRGAGSSYSWGHFYTDTFYGATPAEIETKVREWAARCDSADRRNAEKQKKA